MDRGPDDPRGPEHPVDPFEAIVAGWRREGAVPVWPADDRPPADPPRTPPTAVPPVPRPAAPALRPAPSPDAPDDDADDPDDHFVPPEPPPLPRLGPPAAVGFALLVLGLVLVTVPGVIGVPGVYGLPLGLVTLAAGLGWLVLRLWPGPPEERGEDDDGARL